MNAKKKEELIKIIKFVLFSASAGVIQLGLDILLNEVCLFPKFKLAWLSYLIALVASVLWNFTFNRKFTFKSATNIPIAMLKVAGYYAVFAPLSILWTWGLVDKLGVNEYIILAVTMIINMVTEFLFQKYVVFTDTLKREKEENKTEN